MPLNPIEEIKLIRHQLGADVGYDIHRIFEDLRAAKASSHRTYVDIPQDTSSPHAMQLRRSSEVSSSDDSMPAAS